MLLALALGYEAPGNPQVRCLYSDTAGYGIECFVTVLAAQALDLSSLSHGQKVSMDDEIMSR